MDQQKLDFIANSLIPILNTLPADRAARWGKMNPQQMVEHLSGFFKLSTNKRHFPLVTPAEHLPKYLEFLRRDKQFRENTKAPVLPEEPLPLRLASLNDALYELEKEVIEFRQVFENDPSLIAMHPVFGELNYDDWILLHYKHVSHHLKQFDLL